MNTAMVVTNHNIRVLHQRPKITHRRMVTVIASRTAATSPTRMTVAHTQPHRHILTLTAIIDTKRGAATAVPARATTRAKATTPLIAMQVKTTVVATTAETGSMHRWATATMDFLMRISLNVSEFSSAMWIVLMHKVQCLWSMHSRHCLKEAIWIYS